MCACCAQHRRCIAEPAEAPCTAATANVLQPHQVALCLLPLCGCAPGPSSASSSNSSLRGRGASSSSSMPWWLWPSPSASCSAARLASTGVRSRRGTGVGSFFVLLQGWKSGWCGQKTEAWWHQEQLQLSWTVNHILSCKAGQHRGQAQTRHRYEKLLCAAAGSKRWAVW